jgi:tetratricopeptide (TPR) repeat protein
MKYSAKIVISLFIIFVLGFNIFLKNPSFENKKDHIIFANVTEQYQLAEDLYKELIDSDTTNIDYYYGHITSHYRASSKHQDNEPNYKIGDESHIIKFYKKKSKSSDNFQRNIGLYGLGLCYSIMNSYDSSLEYLEQVNNKKLKYLNNTIGNVHIQNGRYELAKEYFINEIENNGNLTGAYSNLIQLYLHRNQLNELEEILADGNKKYFSIVNLNEYYFKSAQVLKYIYSVFYKYNYFIVILLNRIET